MLAGAGIGVMLSASSTDAVNRSIGALYGEVTAISQTMRNLGGALGIAVLTTVVTHVLTDRLTRSFTRLGATAADARAAVARVGGTGAGGDSGLGKLPAALRRQFLDAVQHDYAEAVRWAFAGAAIAMCVVAVLALCYPRREVSARPTEAGGAKGSSSAPVRV